MKLKTLNPKILTDKSWKSKEWKERNFDQCQTITESLGGLRWMQGMGHE